MAWLITGGAGYIGAHVVKRFTEVGIRTIVLDDLSTGIRSRVPSQIPFVGGSILNAQLVSSVISQYEVTGVVHIAGKKSVAESNRQPALYRQQNVDGTQALLDVCTRHNVRNFIFSSSASVYGLHDEVGPIAEDAPTLPINPYGQSKLDAEHAIKKVASNTSLRAIAFRYFNVGGAASSELADTLGDNLIPVAYRALQTGIPMAVFGTDLPTRDGTCIRDYVHVLDIADAHLSAAQYLDSLEKYGCFQIMNLGSGYGSTVLEVIAAVGAAFGSSVPWVAATRRAGDPVSSVCLPAHASTILGWRVRRTLREVCTR